MLLFVKRKKIMVRYWSSQPSAEINLEPNFEWGPRLGKFNVQHILPRISYLFVRTLWKMEEVQPYPTSYHRCAYLKLMIYWFMNHIQSLQISWILCPSKHQIKRMIWFDKMRLKQDERDSFFMNELLCQSFWDIDTPSPWPILFIIKFQQNWILHFALYSQLTTESCVWFFRNFIFVFQFFV